MLSFCTTWPSESGLSGVIRTLVQPSVDDFEQVIYPGGVARSRYRAGSIVVRITVWFLPLGRT